MMNKRLFSALAAGALFVLLFADCMSAMTPDQQSAQCCGSMPCTPANQSHDCCKAMISVRAPTMLPSARVSLNAPAAVVSQNIPMLEIGRSTPASSATVVSDVPSPQELYTLHGSLLI
jgi:hypothetical protein